MDAFEDLIQRLGLDMSIKVLMHLASPYDIVRFSSVSRHCHQFVIAHGLCKHLCLKMFPEISSLARAIEDRNLIQPLEENINVSSEWKRLERNHKIYSFLSQGLAPDIRPDCIARAISASSTDNFPEESVKNTLEPNDKNEQRASYWSSKGEADPTIPETLIYELQAKLCVVTEIHVQPLQAFFQSGAPIYSAKSVRFRLGHLKYPIDQNVHQLTDDLVAAHKSMVDKFTWTYISPEFPMIQESCLQIFKLPEPVLCVGGVLQVELLGRLQRQEMDNLFYICVSHVQVVGRPISEPFDIEMLDDNGSCSLKYRCHDEIATSMSHTSSSRCSSRGQSHLQSLTAGLMESSIWGWMQQLQSFLLNIAVTVEDETDDEIIS
ncbi:unnamed protein product [Rhodiola kirilowii]